MSYRFEAGRIYRMPTHFGPAPGPRQLPAGVVGDRGRSPRRLSVAASFLTDAAQLERHLPEGFSLAGEAVVTVEFHYMTEIDWLAGRGYTMIHVGLPARFDGARDRASGRFLAVVWESLADPIITGRDEIGHPKLYAEVDAPRQWDGVQLCTAGWMGFRFLELSVADLRAAPIEQAPPSSDGTLMLKYVPRTGAWGEHDLCQVTLTPAADPDSIVESRQLGHGAVRFHRAAWADLPTMYHVVNALAELPVIEQRGGRVQHSRGGKPYLDQKVLL
ncbi:MULTISPECIES: acetoacetate decarboxylase family protein [unclassified Bradyrhizobium]|uniref:acetoacetate decarboxylase family protein n=1 Tax=unclassified Bradyrhizobium TaxID=2631580 RepID=UPI002446A744|nr:MULTISPECIES: acetoacetate decarboxylase family protein [unclassified Bradyrhizobium]MDH2344147.1 acetoacetate decarboxylase family protein [Bradyrhizobium sp. SSUT77]MDH2356113.1 acetoacetate decarboxylase family protein [Bradyrhizobium sp. SSUT112]